MSRKFLRVVLLRDLARHACCHRDCRHTGGTDERFTGCFGSSLFMIFAMSTPVAFPRAKATMPSRRMPRVLR
jgi:hypothetical protein